MANFGQGEYSTHKATILSGSTASDYVNVGRSTIIGFVFPPGFEGASITLNAKTADAGTPYPVKDPISGTAITIQAGASAFVPVNRLDLEALQLFNIVSATVTGADREVTIITRPTV